MVLALMLLKWIASGNLVEAHIIVSRYSFPYFVFGIGPTQSIMMMILLKGSSNVGIGCKGAGGIF